MTTASDCETTLNGLRTDFNLKSEKASDNIRELHELLTQIYLLALVLDKSVHISVK